MYFSSISVRAALILLAVTVEVAWDAVGFVGNERANAQPEGCPVSLATSSFPQRRRLRFHFYSSHAFVFIVEYFQSSYAL